MGKEVVRIAQSKNKNWSWLLTQSHYQTGSQLGMSTLRRAGKSWQKRTWKQKKTRARKRRKLKKEKLKRRIYNIRKTQNCPWETSGVPGSIQETPKPASDLGSV